MNATNLVFELLVGLRLALAGIFKSFGRPFLFGPLLLLALVDCRSPNPSVKFLKRESACCEDLHMGKLKSSSPPVFLDLCRAVKLLVVVTLASSSESSYSPAASASSPSSSSSCSSSSSPSPSSSCAPPSEPSSSSSSESASAASERD